MTKARGTRAPAKRRGPYARAHTSDVVHLLKLAPPGRRGKQTPRATSGGRPILAEGQRWPTCDQCGARLCLYLQFDVEPAFKLAFAPGSHLSIFHCKDCYAIPEFPPGDRLPNAWIAPAFRSFYRIIMNPPGVREKVHKPDPLMVEQQVSFTRSKEKARIVRGGLIGVDEVKIGGLPSWRQSPNYPTCACGAPMGFVMQVPVNKSPGWNSKDGLGVSFAGGLMAFLFFCSAQSSPYAGVIIPDR